MDYSTYEALLQKDDSQISTNVSHRYLQIQKKLGSWNVKNDTFEGCAGNY